MNQKLISRRALIERLLQRKGCTVVTIVACTDARAKKTDNPHGAITKKAVINGMIGWIYENSVNNQRQREGLEPDFEAMPRAWGERIKGTPLVLHKDRHYLEVKVERNLDTTYYRASDGEEIPEEEVKPFLPARSKNERAGTEKDIRLADYGIDNILEIKMDGEHYVVHN